MHKTNWDTKEDQLLEILRPHLSTGEIFEVFKELNIQRTKEAISRRARRLGIEFIDFGEPDAQSLTGEEKKAVVKALSRRAEILASIKPPPIQTAATKSRVSAALKVAAESARERLEERRLEVPRSSSLIKKIAHGPGESLCVVLSDFHIGRKVVDQSTQEIVYDVETGLSRIQSLPSKIVSQVPRRLDKYDEIVVILCGDIVDGEDIFPGHAQQIQQVAEAQSASVVKQLWNTIRDLATIFPLVRIVSAPGNHGRFGASNWDNVVYRQLEILVDSFNNPNILISNKYEKFNTVNVKGFKGLIRHSAPVQADTPSGRAKFGGWYDIHKFDFVCYGHYHHWGIFTWNAKPIFRNGSLIGADDYAEELAVSDIPCQLMFGVTEDYLPTTIVPIVFE